MKIFLYGLSGLIVCLALLLVVLAIWSHNIGKQIEADFPPVGQFMTVDGVKLHYADTGGEDLPMVLFIHGASGNLLDQANIYTDLLKGKARAVFVDRPGHGYSERGPANGEENMDGPAPQARLLAKFVQALGADNAIVVGHSYGGAVAITMALLTPDQVSGVVDISGPTHEWEGGIDWYHNVAGLPVIGPVFVRSIVVPFASATGSMESGVKSVFAPQDVPENYRQNTAPDLLLRPGHFRANSTDVAVLLEHNKSVQDRYGEINVPTSIIHGDVDTIVGLTIHSEKLVEQIEGARLFPLENVGHKPDYVARDLVMQEIRRVAEAAGTPLR